jgi:tetratricopeptide (TPR) repeat protein
MYQYPATVAASAPSATADASPGATPPVSVTTSYPPETGTGGTEMDADTILFFNRARQAFLQDDYRGAMRWASHAAVDVPQNSQVHALMAQILLATEEYRGAATEAHAALTLGPILDWPSLRAHYSDPAKYTNQLRKLEKYVTDNPTSAPGRFLLGYQYLMTGHRAEAKRELTEAVKLTPKDKLASHLLRQLEANQAITPPPMENTATPPNSIAEPPVPQVPAAGREM